MKLNSLFTVCLCKLSHCNLSWAAIGLDGTRQILIMLYLPFANRRNWCNTSVLMPVLGGKEIIFHVCHVL
jgi:hypothetical protein